MSAAQPAPSGRDYAVPAGVVLCAGTFIALLFWWNLTGSFTALIAAFALLALMGAGAAAWGVASLRADDSYGLDEDPEEYLAGLRKGGTNTAKRLTALSRERHLLLPNRVSAARRRLAVAMDKTRPAGRVRTITVSVRRKLKAGPARLRGCLRRKARPAAQASPAPARKSGRHAAAKGSKPQPVAVLVAEPRFPGAGPAVAHEDRTEVLPVLPALILGGETA